MTSTNLSRPMRRIILNGANGTKLADTDAHRWPFVISSLSLSGGFYDDQSFSSIELFDVDSDSGKTSLTFEVSDESI